MSRKKSTPTFKDVAEDAPEKPKAPPTVLELKEPQDPEVLLTRLKEAAGLPTDPAELMALLRKMQAAVVVDASEAGEFGTVQSLSLHQFGGKWFVIRLTVSSGVVDKTEVLHEDETKPGALDAYKQATVVTFLDGAFNAGADS